MTNRDPLLASSLGCPLGWLILSCIFKLVSLFLGLRLGSGGVLGWGIDGVEGHWLVTNRNEVVLRCMCQSY